MEAPNQEKKSLSDLLSDPFVCVKAYLVAIVISALVVLSLYLYYSSHPTTVTYTKLPDNTLILVYGSSGPIDQMKSFAESHGLSVYEVNVHDPTYYLLLGTKKVPLVPPVLSIPAYLCLSQDKNTVIGYYSSDLNVFKLVVSHCYGYTGPSYVYDENTHQVVEVNG